MNIKKNNVKNSSLGIMGITTLLYAQSVQAAGVYSNPTPWNTVAEFIAAALEIALEIGVLVLVVMIIYSGFMFVTSHGNAEKLKKAKHSLTWAIIGGALILGAWALSVAINETIGAL